MNLDLLPREIMALWLPPLHTPPSEWCVEHLRIPKRVATAGTRFSLEMFPYLKEPLDAWIDPWGQEITLKFGTQVGKTTLVGALNVYNAAIDPGPTLVAASVESSVRELFTTRLYPMLRDCHVTRRMLPAEHEQKDLLVELRSMLIFSAWSGSVSKLGEKSIRYLFRSELDKWATEASQEADSEALSGERVKAFANYRIFNEGTPTIKFLSRIERAYLRSDRERYHVPCPLCGVYGPLVCEQIKWPHREDGHSVSADEALEKAWYECPNCKGEVRDIHKPGMLRKGVWVPEGQTARAAKDGEAPVKMAMGNTPCVLDGIPVHSTRRHRGFHLPSWYSPNITWGKTAKAFLDCFSDGQPDVRLLQNFYNGWRAEVWEIKTDATSAEDLAARLSQERPLGVAPPEAEVVILGADVGLHIVHFVARAFNREGRSWLVQHGMLDMPSEAWDIVRGRTFVHEGKGVLEIAGGLIDARYRTEDVEAVVLASRGRMRAIFGDTLKELAFKCFPPKIDPTTGRLDRKVEHFHLNSDYYKERVVAAQRRPPDHKAAWLLAQGVGRDYLEQVTAEGRVLAKDARGRDVYKWQVTGQHGNHYFDCEAYCMAGFEMWREGWAAKQRRIEARPRRREDDEAVGVAWDGTIGV